jgi:hypothetical protein
MIPHYGPPIYGNPDLKEKYVINESIYGTVSLSGVMGDNNIKKRTSSYLW